MPLEKCQKARYMISFRRSSRQRTPGRYLPDTIGLKRVVINAIAVGLRVTRKRIRNCSVVIAEMRLESFIRKFVPESGYFLYIEYKGVQRKG